MSEVSRIVCRVVDLSLIYGPLLKDIYVQRSSEYCLLSFSLSNWDENFVRDCTNQLKFSHWQVLVTSNRYELSFGTDTEKTGFGEAGIPWGENPFDRYLRENHEEESQRLSAVIRSDELIDVDSLYLALKKETWIGNPAVPSKFRDRSFDLR